MGCFFKMLLPFSAAVIIFGLSSCRKEHITLPYEVVYLNDALTFRSVAFFNDSIVVGGSDRDGKGMLLVSDAQFAKTALRQTGEPRSIYSLGLFNDRLFIGSDSVFLSYTDDLQEFHPYYYQREDWVSDLSKHPFRRFAATSSSFFAVAGGNLNFGVLYHSHDTGAKWNPIEHENEFRTVTAFESGSTKHAWAAGNGIYMKSTDDGRTWERKRLDNYFLADMAFRNPKTGCAIDYNGKFLYSIDGGENWAEGSTNPPNTGFLNRIKYFKEYKWIAVGQDGRVYFTTNDGGQWLGFQVGKNLDMRDILILDGNIYLIAFEGAILKIDWPKI